MRKKAIVAIGITFCGFLVSSNVVRAQTWTPLTNAPVTNWDFVGMSGNGNTIVAGIDGERFILTSTNSGATWITNTTPVEFGRAACSADGTKWVCTDGDLDTYRSTNSGVKWFLATENRVGLVGCSADGNILGDYNNLSTNGGTTWTSVSILSGLPAFPDNGSKWIDVILQPINSYLGVYISTNMGMTWITNSIPSTNISYFASAISADGSTILGGAWYSSGGTTQPDALYFTTNSGSSWSKANVDSNVWTGTACSADGSTMVAVAVGNNVFGPYFGSIYTSTNHGVSWVSNNAPNVTWSDVACSADGSKMVAVVGNGGKIYISNSKPSPQLNIASPSNGNFNFSWLMPSTNMALQESPDLMNWTTLTNMPSLNYTNLQEQLTLSPTNSDSFFRLVSQ